MSATSRSRDQAEPADNSSARLAGAVRLIVISVRQVSRLPIRTDQINNSLLHGARTYARAAVLLGTDLLKPLQADRHGLKHRIVPVDPLSALA
jgi:hypothetical protein